MIGLIGQAAGMFAVTNIDDILVLALFFGQAGSRRGAALRVVIGQYLGFVAILAASVVGALGATFLPTTLVPYLGLLPLALGLRAGWQTWTERRSDEDRHDEKRDDEKSGGAENGGADSKSTNRSQPGAFEVATVTFANGGDNIGVYVPVFATSGPGGLATYCAVFLVLVAVWCGLGRFFATRPVIARALTRWGHIILPIVLIGIGTLILIDGGAFGL